MQETLKETIVGTLSLCFNANNVIEKICWLLMWILGSICMCMLISDQFESWKSTISSRKWIDLSEVDAPAITFCHQGNTRLEVADRLLQAADENSVKVRKLRNRFLKHSVEKLLQAESMDWEWGKNSRFEQDPKKIKAIYKEKCHQDSADSACQDCLCDIYNIAFSFAKKHNLTIDELYEKVFLDLNAQDNTSDGLTKIWTNIKADTDEIYKIDFSDGESSW